MIARLWWKEARQFWPIWAFLVVVAAVGQWLALPYLGPDARTGGLMVAAVGWSLLYGFAVTAAAFAGEREGRTLTFLDTMPVGRGVLWSGKASFAVVSTFALAAALVGIAATATRQWDTGTVGLATVAVGALAVILEVIGWGLFWSSVSGNALTAAVLAVTCAGLFTPLFVLRTLDAGPRGLADATPYRLALTFATAAASALVVTGYRPWRRSAAGDRPTLRPESARRWSRWRGRDHDRETRPARAWPSATRSLAWASARQVEAVWGWLAVLGLVASLGFYVSRVGDAAAVAVLLNSLVALTAGVTVFGAENRARTDRFLAHHGVRPGQVWAVKNALWAAGLALLWAPLAVLAAVGPFPFNRGAMNNGPFFVFAAALATCFAVGQLCGMTFRRGITAVVVALVASIGLILPQLGLYAANMRSVGGMTAVPLALLAVSWAWSGDWMIERPGAGRWGRLGLLLAAAFGVLFGTYTASRAWDVPEIGPVLAASVLQTRSGADAGDAPAEINAADLYREAERALPNLELEAPFARLKGHGETLAIVRRASAMPVCRFARLDRMTLFTPMETSPVRRLGEWMALSVRGRQSRGDLTGAWDDLMVMFHMARQQAGTVPLIQGLYCLNTERKALGLAMEWAADPRQSPGTLKAALDEYRDLPPMPAAADVVRAEAVIADRTLRLPTDELRAGVLATIGPTGRSATPLEASGAALVTTPWEVTRARRASRFLFAAKVITASTEPYARPDPVPGEGGWTSDFPTAPGQTGSPLWGVNLYRVEQSTPLVKYLFKNVDAYLHSADRNEVSRRALLMILALRHWQVRHDGRLPDQLAELVHSGELDRLVEDPYTNRAFGYVPSFGQALLPIGMLDPISPPALKLKARSTAGNRLLYSVGPDRRDDHAFGNETTPGADSGDIVFPLPDKVGKSDRR